MIQEGRNAEMKWKTPEKRLYYSKYRQIDIRSGQGWYECYELPGDVYAVCEPQHLQEVNVFLIFGETRVLMLDTGMGICDIRPVIEELVTLRCRAQAEDMLDNLIVVNCHLHFDHTGNAWRFPEIVTADVPIVRRQAREGVPHEPLANQADEDMFLFGYPKGFVPEDYCIRPYHIRCCEDGHRFRLGGREVEFITTPGHTEDHAMLYDHRDGILFAGDMIYFGAIYVQFDNEILGHSDIQEYIDSLEKVKRRCPDMRSIYVSHNDFITDLSAIDKIRDALIAVRDGEAEGEPLRDEKYGYYGDPPTMRQYWFDGFSVVAGK